MKKILTIIASFGLAVQPTIALSSVVSCVNQISNEVQEKWDSLIEMTISDLNGIISNDKNEVQYGYDKLVVGEKIQLKEIDDIMQSEFDINANQTVILQHITQYINTIRKTGIFREKYLNVLLEYITASKILNYLSWDNPNEQS